MNDGHGVCLEPATTNSDIICAVNDTAKPPLPQTHLQNRDPDRYFHAVLVLVCYKESSASHMQPDTYHVVGAGVTQLLHCPLQSTFYTQTRRPQQRVSTIQR